LTGHVTRRLTNLIKHLVRHLGNLTKHLILMPVGDRTECNF